MRESAIWVGFYVAHRPAVRPGGAGRLRRRFAGQFYAGWLTEYSLSIDNLFVFVIIMARFAVPRQYQQKVLLVGIVLALVHARASSSPPAPPPSAAFMLGVLPVRRVPALHRGQVRRGRATTDEDDYKENAADPAGPRGSCRSPERATTAPHLTSRPSGRRDLHPAGHRDDRPRHHRPALRARLDPGHLRADQGAVPGLHRERVRADGPAPAVLPASAACSTGSCTCRSAWPSCSASSASS